MMALVIACNLTFKDWSLPSCNNWDDQTKWCLVVFHRSERDQRCVLSRQECKRYDLEY
jgi:hypothetical protein